MAGMTFFFEKCSDVIGLALGAALPCGYHNIVTLGEISFIFPVSLPDNSSGTAPHDSISDFLACGNAYPVFFSAVAAVIYRTHSAGNESALAVEPNKFLVIFKSDSKKHGNSAS